MTWSYYLLQGLLIVIVTFSLTRFFKWPLVSFLYLSLLPMLVFYRFDLPLLALALLLGSALYLLLKRSVLQGSVLLRMVPLAALVLLAFYWYRPTLDMQKIADYLQAVNQQRGEHLNYLPQLGRLLHNKTDLIYFLYTNLESYFSPVTLFAHAPYGFLYAFYPLGLLFPWDFLLLIRTVLNGSAAKDKRSLLTGLSAFFILLFPLTLPLRGEFNRLITLALSFFIALYIAGRLSTLPKKFLAALLLLNLGFLIWHYQLLPVYLLPL